MEEYLRFLEGINEFSQHIKTVYDSFISVGFDEDQALVLTQAFMGNIMMIGGACNG